MTKTRSTLSLQDLWNVEAMYPSLSAWEEDLTHWSEGKWKALTQFQGILKDGPSILLKFLDLYFDTDKHLTKIYTYAHLRHDEDVTEETYKQAYAKAVSTLHAFRQALSWVEPEILTLPPSITSDPVLKNYHIYLQNILRLKPHVLSPSEESLMALMGKALDTPYQTFGAFNHGDLKFPDVQDAQGNAKPLTHGTYQLYLKSQDRVLRKHAFETLHRSFLSHENTLCELLNGLVQKHVCTAKARGYASSLSAALFPYEIDETVYRELISAVRKRLPSLHKYMRMRKRHLGLKEMHPYDLYVPLIDFSWHIPYERAEKLLIQSVAPLGLAYQSMLKKGLIEDRWVDRYETPRKRSGAYSSGCYGSMPYILMNYHGELYDAMTLSHEAGHSMHSLLSNTHQPYPYSGYSIFLAEIASTFHEELFIQELFKHTSKEEENIFLINQQIESIRTTFFRQTLFAEFELKIHELAEANIPLTPALLKSEYRALNAAYFGPDVTLGEEIDIEWARIPHFYYNFYVYQYATGISAAHAFAKKITEPGAQEKYLQFLSSGSSRPPLTLLAEAGIDMRKQTAVETLIDHFDHLVERMESKIS